MSRREVLVVRTDSDGDVLLSGPAIRAVARDARVTVLVAPSGAAAAALLPDVADVIVHPVAWSGYRPPPLDAAATLALVDDVRGRRFDAAVVLTSFHQSPLPVALLLRLAGVPHITAASGDYPGSLLDVRLAPVRAGDPRHEVERALDTVAAAGFRLDPHDDARLAVRRPLPLPPDVPRSALPRRGYVVVHPGASVPARAPGSATAAAIVRAVDAAGWPVAVTGGRPETDLTAQVAGDAAVDLGGRTTFPELGAVLAGAACLVSGNTGPAHLAAAVGTPVVSLFAPVVPAAWWRPWGVPHVLLGDQHAACRDSRSRECPVPGHPCLSTVDPSDVVEAVATLTDARRVPAAGRSAS